jgi:hypothetical protein
VTAETLTSSGLGDIVRVVLPHMINLQRRWSLLVILGSTLLLLAGTRRTCSRQQRSAAAQALLSRAKLLTVAQIASLTLRLVRLVSVTACYNPLKL